MASVAHWIERQPVNQKSLVRFLFRAHAWVVGQVPCGGRVRGNQSMYLSHIDICFSLLPFPSL